MKKMIAMLLALCMLLAVVPALAEEAENTLTMATEATFPPYEFYEGEEIVGIDVEIATAIAEKLGMKLVVEDTAFDAIIASVATGKVDFAMAGLTVNEERLESVSFSTSYATGVQVVIVKEDSPITSVDDLFAEDADYKVGVQAGTTGDIYCSDDLGSDHVEQFKTGADAVAALVAGKVDCVVIDNEPAKNFVAANEGLKILETAYADEDYAIAVSYDQPELLEKINSALEELIADGTVAAIVEKYIPSEEAAE